MLLWSGWTGSTIGVCWRSPEPTAGRGRVTQQKRSPENAGRFKYYMVKALSQLCNRRCKNTKWAPMDWCSKGMRREC